MTRLVVLWARMLRFRVAVMIWMFMLLAVALHGGLASMKWDAVWATVLLSASYVAATSVSDIADREIDLVNHPKDRGRPLVSGDATPRDLVRVNAAGALLALGAAVPLGTPGIAIAAASLAIGYAYSVAPARLSFRTYAAPLLLAMAYVLVPYAAGLVVVGDAPGGRDALMAAALYLLFVAVLRELRRADDPRMEQVAIGLGARMGNGLLIAAPAWLALEAEGAPPLVRGGVRRRPRRAVRRERPRAGRVAARGADRPQGLRFPPQVYCRLPSPRPDPPSRPRSIATPSTMTMIPAASSPPPAAVNSFCAIA